jgi:two-component system nitrate/nitrite sensor histidine kinase NarX
MVGARAVRLTKLKRERDAQMHRLGSGRMVSRGAMRSNIRMQPAFTAIPSPPGRSAQAGLLADIAAGLATGSDLATLLEQLLAPIVRLAGAQSGAVRVLSVAGDTLELVGAIGLPAQPCSGGPVAGSDCGPCGAAAGSQRMVWACDASECSAPSAQGAGAAPACQHMMAGPLRHRGRTLGVYNLFFAHDREPSADVREILQSVGELLGLALNNARLEQEHLRATLLRERQMMAADVHDSLAQSLAFVKMRMPLLHDAMRAHDDVQGQRYYEEVRGAISQAHASLRAIVSQLRLPMDPQGLLHALGSTAEHFRIGSGIELEFVNELPSLKLPVEQETQVFHIVQEALTNVARHAGAEHAWLRIARANGSVRIEVEDDGSGLPAQASRGTHYGMDIMAERARRIGAALEIGRRDEGGTRVRLTVPAAPKAD